MNLKSEGYLHAITLFALFSLFHPLSALQNVTLLFLGRKLARDAYTSTSAVTLIGTLSKSLRLALIRLPEVNFP